MGMAGKKITDNMDYFYNGVDSFIEKFYSGQQQISKNERLNALASYERQ